MAAVAEAVETKVKKEVPALRDEGGVLRKLKGSDFPTSKAGKVAKHEYQIERHKEAIVDINTADDPKKKLARKYSKMLVALKAMQELAVEQGVELQK